MKRPSQCERVLAVLSDGRPHTITEIHDRAGTMRLNSRVSELRGRGHNIDCWRDGDEYVYCLKPGPAPPRKALARFKHFLNQAPLTYGPDACWPWREGLTTTPPSSAGYARLWSGGREQQAHRVAYELLVGPIPKGLVLDHLCRNPCCSNPSHLEPVTQRENWARGESPPAKSTRSNHCARGHSFDEENTLWSVRRGKRVRQCRACKRAADRIRWADPNGHTRIHDRERTPRRRSSLTSEPVSAVNPESPSAGIGSDVSEAALARPVAMHEAEPARGNAESEGEASLTLFRQGPRGGGFQPPQGRAMLGRSESATPLQLFDEPPRKREPAWR